MNLSCSSRMIKYLMFAFNLFFVISGIIIIAVGATVKTVYSEYSYFLDTKYFTLPNMLIATGVFIFIISFFGCCGAVKESWIMLGVFSILLCIIFLFEFSAGIAGYVLRDKTIDYLDTTLRNNLGNYKNSTHAIWDSIQGGFQCCGVDSYTDWKGKFENEYELPVSCCPAASGTTGQFYCNSYITTTATEAPLQTAAMDGDQSRRKRALNVDTPTEGDSPKNDENPKTDPSTVAPTAAPTAAPTPAQSTSLPYTTGCKTAFGQYIKKHAVQIGGCALGLAVIQILGIVFSCHLVRQLKNGYYST